MWNGDLTRQILRDQTEAARLRGASSLDEESPTMHGEKTVLRDHAVDRRRRVVTTRKERTEP